MDKYLKENQHYKALFSQLAQQALISVCEPFSSYDALLPKWFKGELADQPKPPHYRKAGGLAGFSYAIALKPLSILPSSTTGQR